MISILIGLTPDFSQIAQQVLPFFFEMASKGTLLLVVAAVVTLSLRAAVSSSIRHLIWSLAIFCLLLMPIFELAIPEWNLPLLPQVAPNAESAGFASTETVADLQVIEPASSFTSSELRFEADAIEAVPARWEATAEGTSSLLSRFDPGWILIGLWIFGFAAVLFRMGIGVLRLRQVVRRGQKVSADSWLTMLRILSAGFGLRHPIKLIVSSEISVPLTWGIIRPVVLLSVDSLRLSAESRRIVLLHELSHIRRKDCLTQLLAQVACAIYWWNPLVWFAARRLRIERELACDDSVLEAGTRATDYAGCLITFAGDASHSRFSSPLIIGMACSGLEKRVRSILDPTVGRDGLNRIRVTLATGLALGLLAPLSAINPWVIRADESSRNAAPLAYDSVEEYYPPDCILKYWPESEERETKPPIRTQVVASSSVIRSAADIDEPTESTATNDTRAAVTRPEQKSEDRSSKESDLVAESVHQQVSQEMSNLDIRINQSVGHIVKNVRFPAVSAAYVEEMRRAGYDGLTTDQLMRLRIHGIDEAFANSVNSMGFGKLSYDELMHARIFNITPRLLSEVQQMGFINPSLKQLVMIRIYRITPDFVREMKDAGFQSLSLDQLIRTKIHGITGEYLTKIKQAGHINLSINRIIDLKIRGFDQPLFTPHR